VPSQCRQATSWRRAAGNYKALSDSLVFTPSAIAVTPMWITEAGTSMNRVYIAHLFVHYRQVVATKRIERCMYTTPGWRVPDSPVEVVANDPKDLTNTQPIRSHLGHIAVNFGTGDFSAPMFTHDGVPPGVTTVKLMKSAIHYAYEEMPSGGQSTDTGDPIAVASIHDFMRFQITEHQTAMCASRSCRCRPEEQPGFNWRVRMVSCQRGRPASFITSTAANMDSSSKVVLTIQQVMRVSASHCALLKSFSARYPHPPGGGSMLRSLARAFTSFGISLLFPLFVQAQALPFSVGTATAAPGQKSTGYLQVPAGVDAASNIPVIVINGQKRGPVLALVSGAHGTEYASIIALEKLINLLDPSQIAGTVILVPLVNIQSFEQKVPHVNPIDNKSMNRFYPGKADGTQTERASFLITKQVVDRCDYLIDYHGGDLDESLRPYAYWAPTGKETQDRISKEMVLAFGIDHIIIWRDRPTDLAATRYLDNTSTVRGKPSIVVEAGYAGVVESDDVALLVDGTLNAMRALKMLSGDPRPISNPVWLDRIVDVLSDGPGIWYPLVKRGTYVQEGMELGFVTDYFGKVIFEARAPVSGVILHINAVPSLKKNDNIADIAAIAAHAP